MEDIQSTLQDTVQSVKKSLTAPLSTPPELTSCASASDLSNRLNWGEPALTIIDVRDRHAFDQERITGAVNIPMAQLVEQAQAHLEVSRDIYIYSDSNDETAQAAQSLRSAGFERVAELDGGLSGWKAINAALEGASV